MGAMTSSLAAKFAFFPPTPPSYAIVKDPSTGRLRFDSIAPQDHVDVLLIDTRRRQQVAAMFVRNPRARLTLLYSHGNAADLGQMHDLYVELAHMLRVNLMGYDYTGYGASTGKPSEADTYADVEAVMTCLQQRYSIGAEQVVLYGQSVGSGPTVDLAPIASGVRVLYEVKHTYWFDIFPGTSDEVVDVSHGQMLVDACKRPFEPLFLEGGHHCDLEFFPEYLRCLRKYISYLVQHPPVPQPDLPRKAKKRPGWGTPLTAIRSFVTPNRHRHPSGTASAPATPVGSFSSSSSASPHLQRERVPCCFPLCRRLLLVLCGSQPAHAVVEAQGAVTCVSVLPVHVAGCTEEEGRGGRRGGARAEQEALGVAGVSQGKAPGGAASAAAASAAAAVAAPAVNGQAGEGNSSAAAAAGGVANTGHTVAAPEVAAMAGEVGSSQ
ncbi:hypothetical protein CLOP_g5155 [Closterium sp. NIES-67]|nr:hypothetical protein CLOP_g5155 [Closterium sp. NIES-67]